MPHIAANIQFSDSVIDPETFDYPESEQLHLPSFYPLQNREIFGIKSLADIELRLRQGQAKDLLDRARASVLAYEQTAKVKSTQLSGQMQLTRSNRLLQSIKDQQKALVEEYSRTRKAMIKLGLADSDKTFQQLSEEHFKLVRNTVGDRTIGESRVSDSWIWYGERASALSLQINSSKLNELTNEGQSSPNAK